MIVKTIYQTLEDRDNPDYIELHAPFKCNRKNAWLGNGYYFWDTFIEIAHWWGEFSYNNSYVICEASCDFNEENCLDLVGNTEHMLEFHNAINLLKKQKLIKNKTTVARILSFMKSKIPEFNYDAIRVYGINSIGNKEENKKYLYRLPFITNQAQFLDYKPPIQICVFNKKRVNFRNFKIVYPDKYIIDFMI